MKYFGARFIYALLLAACLSGEGFSSDQVESEDDFKRRATVYRVLPEGNRTDDNLDIAWKHQRAIRAMAKDNPSLFPTILPDGEIATKNKMGMNWGFHPAVTCTISELIDPAQPTNLLEVGSCYGFDAIALIKKNPQLRVTALELSEDHVSVMNQLVERILPDNEEKSRLEVLHADFLSPAAILQENFYDITVLSRVLHFYNDQLIDQFLRKLYSAMKPGGYVVMSQMSNRALKVLEYMTWAFGGYLPKPEGLIRSVKTWGSIDWEYHFSTEDIKRLTETTGFKIITNEYLGIMNEKNAAKYWFLGGLNMQEATLFTVLQKPED